MVKLQRSTPGLGIDQIIWESEEKDYQITYTDFVITGAIIGELNCLTNEPMKYSATCKTVVEAYFIPKNHLYEAFEQFCPHIEYKMWLKLGLSITAKKIREHLSYEIQGIEDFTKVAIVQTSIDVKKFRWNTSKYRAAHKSTRPAASAAASRANEKHPQNETNTQNQKPIEEADKNQGEEHL